MVESHSVLVLEPSTANALSLETAFYEQQVCNPVRILRNGYELRSYLKGAGQYANREVFPIPSLLLLDFSDATTAVNLLEWLRDRGYLDHFPVIGVGNTASSPVLQLAFDMGMHGYFEKPADLRKLAKMVCEIRWVDGWNMQLSESADVHLLTREQFYRMGAA